MINLKDETYYNLIFNDNFDFNFDNVYNFISESLLSDLNNNIIDLETKIFIKIFNKKNILSNKNIITIIEKIKENIYSLDFSNIPIFFINDDFFEDSYLKFNVFKYVNSKEKYDKNKIYYFNTKIDTIFDDIKKLLDENIFNLEFNIKKIPNTQKEKMKLCNQLIDLCEYCYENSLYKKINLFPFRINKMFSIYEYLNLEKIMSFVENNKYIICKEDGISSEINSPSILKQNKKIFGNKNNNDFHDIGNIFFYKEMALASLWFMNHRYKNRKTKKAETFIKSVIKDFSDLENSGIQSFYDDYIKF